MIQLHPSIAPCNLFPNILIDDDNNPLFQKHHSNYFEYFSYVI